MGAFSIVLLIAALGGALASWILGAVYFARGTREHWIAAAAWPLGMRRLREAAAAEAAVVNKAMVAFIVCMTLAAATISLATNFNRIRT